MSRSLTVAAAVLGFLAVALGAFGVHALREGMHMQARWLDTWDRGVTFQMFHSIVVFVVALSADKFGASATTAVRAGWLMVVGAAIFCGSLYALSLTSLSASGPLLTLGAVAPIGGLCFLSGWAGLILAAVRSGNATP